MKGASLRPVVPVSRRIRGRRLQAIRLSFLARYPLCKHCIGRGLVVAAVEVDHVVPLFKGGTDTDDNRQGLCADCHRAKTIDDFGQRPKGADLAGWPTDPGHPWNATAPQAE